MRLEPIPMNENDELTLRVWTKRAIPYVEIGHKRVGNQNDLYRIDKKITMPLSHLKILYELATKQVKPS